MNSLIGIVVLLVATFIVSMFQSLMKDVDEKWAEWVFVLVNFLLVFLSVRSFV